MEDRKAIIIGISGCSSSGKTTLARLLRDIFPNTMILHEDDFYKPEAEYELAPPRHATPRLLFPRRAVASHPTSCPIPSNFPPVSHGATNTKSRLPTHHGFLDWDCADAISVPAMQVALEHIRATGTFPVGTRPSVPQSARADHGCLPPPRSPKHTTKRTCQSNVDSKEDQNSVGKCPVSNDKIDEMKAKVASWLQQGRAGHRLFNERRLQICLFDGFLIYSQEMRHIMKLMDIKLLLLVSRGKATKRREARDGYVTLEGFWKDPPGYVDKIVWPNYAEEHAWLFKRGNVEGEPDKDVLERAGISTQLDQGLDVSMGTSLEWAVNQIIGKLEEME